MTAEDDYPAHGVRGGTVELEDGMYEQMCDEIDRLRAEVDDLGRYIARRYEQSVDAVAALRALADQYERQLDMTAKEPA